MSSIVIFTANLFVLIVSLMGAQACYFRARWKWFWLMLLCIVMSSVCIAIVANQWLNPVSPDLPGLNLRPTSPL